jgi:F1F0 ATPase subunit 2
MPVPIWQLVLALVAGAAAGLFYFGGLWWTVRRVPTSPRPHLLTLGSFAARTVVVVAMVVWLARQHWVLVVACLATFIAVRVLMVRRLRPPVVRPEAGER